MTTRLPRFLPGWSSAAPAPPPPNPDIFKTTSTAKPGNGFFPAASPIPGSTVWAHYFTDTPTDVPVWILADLTTQTFGVTNVAVVQGDGTYTLKMWSVAVPATAIGVRIATAVGASAAAVLWRMGAVNEADDGVQSNQATPHTNHPSDRAQAYIIGGCVGAHPHMTTIPGESMGLVVANRSAVIGAVPNTPGVPYPCTYTVDSGHTLGFAQTYTDSRPPTL